MSQRIIFKVQVDDNEERRSDENEVDVIMHELSESQEREIHLQTLRQRMGGMRAFFGTLSFILSFMDFQLPNQKV